MEIESKFEKGRLPEKVVIQCKSLVGDSDTDWFEKKIKLWTDAISFDASKFRWQPNNFSNENLENFCVF